ncbi:MAG TPA: lyase family protein, partial [Terriglobales bacterium]|nr:lyase family protein [Terriglobales bacterium]
RLGSYPLYVRALAQVKLAAARANRDAGALPPAATRAIESAAAALIAGEHLDQFPVDVLGGGGSIAINVNVNEVIAALANSEGSRRGRAARIEPQDVNASQSTADVCHTAARLAIASAGTALLAAVDGCVAAIRQLDARFGAVLTLARTCLRDAMPVTYTVLLSGYIEVLERRRRELARQIAGLSTVTLGGTVIGTGAGAPAAYRRRVVPELAKITGLELCRHRHPADALQHSDDLAAVSAEVASLAQAGSKIAADLRLLASGPSGGFAEVILPHVQQGSSFFAGKSNPVVPETMIQCAFQVLACNHAVQLAAGAAELQLNVYDGAAAINVMDAIAMLTSALQHLDQQCLQALEVDEQRCQQLAATAKHR